MYDRKTPYMIQYLFNIQRELGVTRRWRLAISDRAASGSSGCSIAMKWCPAPSATSRTGGRIRSSPGFRKSATSRKPKYNSLAVKLTRRLDKGLSVLGRLHVLEIDRQRQRHPHAQRRSAVPAEQRMLRVRVGLVDLRRAAPVRVVDSLRAAVRRGQTVRPRRASARAILGGWQVSNDHQRVERLPTKLRSRFGSSNTGSDQRANLVPGQDPNDGPKTIASGSTRTRSRSSRLAPTATPEKHHHRTRDLQFRHVDYPELQIRHQQEPAVQARSVQRVEPAGLERSEHVVGESRAVRNDQQHEKADARAAARREVRVLETRTSSQHGDTGARRIFQEDPPCPFGLGARPALHFLFAATHEN